MKSLHAITFTVLAAFSLQAQTTLKIGYADVEYIFSQMPESKTIEAELQALQTQLKKGIDTQIANFQKKVAEYQQFGANVPEAVRQNTEREIRQIQENIEKMQQDAQNEMQRKQTQLMEPIYQRVGKAIEDVAKENGFSLILNNQISGLDVILYGDEKLDISDLVLKKLGVTPKPQTGNK